MIRREKSKSRGGYVYLYDIRIWRGGRWVRKQRSNFPTREDAKHAADLELAASHRRQHGITPDDAHKAARPTLAQLVEARCNQLLIEPTDRRKQSVKVIRRWLTMVDPAKPVEETRKADVTLYRDLRSAEDVQPSTVFREITDIVSCLNSASEFFAELEEYRAPKRPKVVVDETTRQVVYQPEQIVVMLAWLRRPAGDSDRRQPRQHRARLDTADYFQIALQTGARSGEIRRLHRTDVNLIWKKLRLYNYKKKRDELIDIPDNLVALFRRRIEQPAIESEWLFPSDRDPSRPIKRFFDAALKQAAAHAGLKWGYKEPGGVVFHTTRHTAITKLLDAGTDIATIQHQARLSKKTVLLTYGHATAASTRRAAAALAEFGEVGDMGTGATEGKKQVSKNPPS